MPGISILVALYLLPLHFPLPLGTQFRCEDGVVDFISDASLEKIEASNRSLKGIIDAEQHTFAWSIPMRSFTGFNSSLQREHFFENYVETEKYPVATFNGKIIEKIDFTTDGNYTVRAKGKLVIHGVEQERIIKSSVQVKGKKLLVNSSFTVLLSDHNIAIPKIVSQKISPEIKVSVSATLLRSE